MQTWLDKGTQISLSRVGVKQSLAGMSKCESDHVLFALEGSAVNVCGTVLFPSSVRGQTLASHDKQVYSVLSKW